MTTRNNSNRIPQGVSIPPSSPSETAMPETPPQFMEQPSQVQYNKFLYKETVRLPSKGKYYSPNFSLYGKETVDINEITSDEENILTAKGLSLRKETTKALIQSLLGDTRLDTGKLLSGDRDAILLSARITAYGDIYEASLGCPFCGKMVHNYNFDLVKALNDAWRRLENPTHKLFELGQVTPGQLPGQFNVTLLKTKWPALIKLLSAQEIDEYLADAEMHKPDDEERSNLFFSDEKNASSWIRTMLLSLNGVSDAYELDQFILPARDMAFLRDVYKALNPALILKHSFKCPHCQGADTITIPIGINFFRLVG